ncbi:MAG: hypothetical protein U9Q21_04140 [Candidatus Auribacterota bacterium]|nr:hypothetical protein [Candidatus Auribacterota bacterium]
MKRVLSGVLVFFIAISFVITSFPSDLYAKTKAKKHSGRAALWLPLQRHIKYLRTACLEMEKNRFNNARIGAAYVANSSRNPELRGKALSLLSEINDREVIYLAKRTELRRPKSKAEIKAFKKSKREIRARRRAERKAILEVKKQKRALERQKRREAKARRKIQKEAKRKEKREERKRRQEERKAKAKNK